MIWPMASRQPLQDEISFKTYLVCNMYSGAIILARCYVTFAQFGGVATLLLEVGTSVTALPL